MDKYIFFLSITLESKHFASTRENLGKQKNI